MDIAIIPQPVSLTRHAGQCNLSSAAIYAGAEALETAGMVQKGARVGLECRARSLAGPAGWNWSLGRILNAWGRKATAW